MQPTSAASGICFTSSALNVIMISRRISAVPLYAREIILRRFRQFGRRSGDFAARERPFHDLAIVALRSSNENPSTRERFGRNGTKAAPNIIRDRNETLVSQNVLSLESISLKDEEAGHSYNETKAMEGNSSYCRLF